MKKIILAIVGALLLLVSCKPVEISEIQFENNWKENGFNGRLDIKCVGNFKDEKPVIYYTTDGSIPTKESEELIVSAWVPLKPDEWSFTINVLAVIKTKKGEITKKAQKTYNIDIKNLYDLTKSDGFFVKYVSDEYRKISEPELINGKGFYSSKEYPTRVLTSPATYEDRYLNNTGSPLVVSIETYPGSGSSVSAYYIQNEPYKKQDIRSNTPTTIPNNAKVYITGSVTKYMVLGHDIAYSYKITAE